MPCTAEGRPNLDCLSLHNDGSHQGLTTQNDIDNKLPVAPLLSNSRELSSNEVQRALQMKDAKEDYNDEYAEFKPNIGRQNFSMYSIGA